MSDADRELRWIGSSLDDLSALPDEVKLVFGFALRQAQRGGRHPQAKPLKGQGGAGVLEIVESHDGDACRAVYTVKFSTAVYVLHAFQKKSKKGAETPKPDLDLIQLRLKAAEADHRSSTPASAAETEESHIMTDASDISVRRSSGDVFADLGFDDAKELSLKAELALKIGRVMKEQRLSQTRAAALAGVSQPDVSRILRGQFRDVSTDRLIRILLGLRADIDITVRHDGRVVGDVIHVASGQA